jgi:hypothetical protein
VPSKHSFTSAGLARLLPGDNARLRRGWTVVGAVFAAAAVVWSVVWVQHSATRDPQAMMMEPAPPAVPASRSSAPPRVSLSIAPSMVTAPASPSVTVSPALPSTPTRSTSVSAAPVPKKSSSRPAVSALSATYTVGSSWQTGFIGGVTVTNNGSSAVAWTVTVRNRSADGVKISSAWNATVSRQGDTDTFTGGPLAPGATASFGFEATKQATGKVEPAGCTVNQSACRVS